MTEVIVGLSSAAYSLPLREMAMEAVGRAAGAWWKKCAASPQSRAHEGTAKLNTACRRHAHHRSHQGMIFDLLLWWCPSGRPACSPAALGASHGHHRHRALRCHLWATAAVPGTTQRVIEDGHHAARFGGPQGSVTVTRRRTYKEPAARREPLIKISNIVALLIVPLLPSPRHEQHGWKPRHPAASRPQRLR